MESFYSLIEVEVEDNKRSSPNITCIPESWISLVSPPTQLAHISFSNQFFYQKVIIVQLFPL